MKNQFLAILLFFTLNYSVHSATEVIYPYITPCDKPLTYLRIDNGLINPYEECRQNVKNLCKRNDITGMINFYCENKRDERRVPLLGYLFFPDEILEETHLASYAEQNETVKIALLISAKYDHREAQKIVKSLFYENLDIKFPLTKKDDARDSLQLARVFINNKDMESAYLNYMNAAQKKSLRAIFEIIYHYVLPKSKTIEDFDIQVNELITSIHLCTEYTFAYIDYIKASFHQYGEGVFSRDLKKANHHYKQAIQKGFSAAHIDYGDFLLSLTSIFSGNIEKCSTFKQFALESYIQAGQIGIFQGYQKAIEVILRNKALFNREIHMRTIALFNDLVERSLTPEHELSLSYEKIKKLVREEMENFTCFNLRNNNRNAFETLFTEVEEKLKDIK